MSKARSRLKRADCCPQRVLVHRAEGLLALCNFLVREGGNVSAENQWRTDGSLERKVGFFSYS